MTQEKKYQSLIMPEVHWKKDEIGVDGISITAECTIKPIENGFGVTYGNTLRRILLGGIEGSSVVAVRITGVNNECSLIAGVKEDVFHIILNIKELVIKNETGEPGTFSVKKEGAGLVCAKDFSGDAHLSILNKDALIATLAEDGALEMTIFVESGRGFKKAIASSEKKEGEEGKIYINALFAPVTLVAFTVEKTRIGKDIDYDKLMLSITTNGAITPQYAFHYAVSVAIEQFNALLNAQNVIKFPVHESQGVKEQDKIFSSAISEAFMDSQRRSTMGSGMFSDQDSRFAYLKKFKKITPSFLLKSIDVLELSVRVHNCLISIGVRRVIDLVNIAEEQLWLIKNFGKKSYDNLVKKMEQYDLSFNMKIKEEDVVDYGEREI